MKLRKNIAVSETGFVFDPNSGDSYSLNPVGVEILEMLKLQQDKEQIFSDLLARYDVDRQTLEQNLDDFLAMLQRYNFIES